MIEFLNSVGGFIAGVVTLIGALAAGYKVWSDGRREDRKQEANQRLEEAQRAEIAAKLGVELQASTNKMLSDFAEMLKRDAENANRRIEVLEQGKQERNTQINELQLAQAGYETQMREMSKELETLRKENAAKEKTIKGQGERITELEKENATIKAQLRTMIRELQKAQLPIPDGVEHDGNGEKESGGGA